MKGTPMSLWLSAANRAAGWWVGHAANAMRRQQRAALAEFAKASTGAAVTPGAKAKRKRRPQRRGRKRGAPHP